MVEASVSPSVQASDDYSPDNSTNPIPFLIDSFFQNIYPLPSYSFLHPSSTRRKFTDGTLDKSLTYAIAAISSLRTPGWPRPLRIQDLEKTWIEEAESLIWQNLESPSIARVQATLLVVLYRAETAQLRRAFMLASLAGRAAAAMRLNHERPASVSAAGEVSLEMRRRLMWSLKMVERYFSVGLPEFELCPVENIYIRLPCNEYQFSGTPESSWEMTDDGAAYHICVKLEMFRRDVMKLQRSLQLYEEAFLQLPRLMGDFQQHLERIRAQFPDTTVDDEHYDLDRPAWMSRRLVSGRWLPRHLLMRLSWHQCHCDLYRLLLRNFRDAAPKVIIDGLETDFLDTAERRCIHHARSIVQAISALSAVLPEEKTDVHQAEPRLLEFDTAICAYTASRILLFTSRFGQTSSCPSEDFALSRTKLCLATVHKFFPRSLLVRPIVGELERLIEIFSAGRSTSPHRFSSPRPECVRAGDGEGGEVKAVGGWTGSRGRPRDPVRQLSGAARIRQRLAIHSLLRQADFSDDEDEQDMGSGHPQPVSTATYTISASTTFTETAPTPPTFEQTSSQFSPDQGHTLPTNGDYTPLAPQQGNPDPSWPHRFFVGGDLLQTDDGPVSKEEEEVDDEMAVAAPGGALNQRSFLFPWLQREETEMSTTVG